MTPSPDASHSDLWGAVDEATIWRTWPGECALFSPGRGETHLLSALAASVMLRLLKAPATVDDLMAADLVPESADGASHSSIEEIRNALAVLASRGLVARFAPTKTIDRR